MAVKQDRKELEENYKKNDKISGQKLKKIWNKKEFKLYLFWTNKFSFEWRDTLKLTNKNSDIIRNLKI